MTTPKLQLFFTYAPGITIGINTGSKDPYKAGMTGGDTSLVGTYHNTSLVPVSMPRTYLPHTSPCTHFNTQDLLASYTSQKSILDPIAGAGWYEHFYKGTQHQGPAPPMF